MLGTLLKPLRSNQTNAKLGRPPVLSEEERRKLILDAAERVFTTDGYGAATMEGIIRAAGMSKKTVYALFSDKEHLFAALIGDAGAFPGGKSKVGVKPSDTVGELRDHLLSLAEFVLSPHQVAMTRLVISEARHSPKLADEFYARVMAKGQIHLTEGVARVLKAKGVEVDDIETTSMALFGAALGGLHLAALFGRQERFPRELLVAQIDLAIGLLLPNLLRQAEQRLTVEEATETKTK